jgi:hypothetical protein
MLLHVKYNCIFIPGSWEDFSSKFCHLHVFQTFDHNSLETKYPWS